jgi:hypothetical protein
MFLPNCFSENVSFLTTKKMNQVVIDMPSNDSGKNISGYQEEQNCAFNHTQRLLIIKLHWNIGTQSPLTD